MTFKRLHNVEFESFRQTKYDSYCTKIKHLVTIHFIIMKFHMYLSIKYDFQTVVSFKMKSLFSLDNLCLLFTSAHQTIIKDKQE
jgi:hypothetical protein